MQLPFTHDQFLDLFGDYNRALWPAVVVLWVVTLVALFQLYRQRPNASRHLAGLLGFHWAWSGLVYHLVFFRRINPAAVVFGIAFLVQAALVVWWGIARADLTFGGAPLGWRRLGIGLILYAMAYPVLGLLFGLQSPRLPTFGIPCPTTILTAGLLLLTPGGRVRLGGVIPVLWAGVGGSAAFVLGIRADLALPIAGAFLLVRMLMPARKTQERAT